MDSKAEPRSALRESSRSLNGTKFTPYPKSTTNGVRGRCNDKMGLEEMAVEDPESYRRLTKSTAADVADMRRMGRDQELVRSFRTFSVASFAAVATAVWEFAIFQITPALIDGGSPTLVYSAIWAFIGFGPIYLSMAEMASMAPIAGAQYHWVSEFAPESMQKSLSYVSGWTSSLALQAGQSLGVLLTGTLIQTTIRVNYPEYTAPSWHTFLFILVAVVTAFAGSVWGYRVLPHWQNAAFAFHVLAYFAVLIPIWVNSPKATSEKVWTGFENFGGWSNLALAVMIGQLPGLSFQVGVDATVHMAEEVRNAAVSVPKAMLAVYITDFVLVLPMLVTIVYHIPDTTAALEDVSTYPVVYVLRQSMSTAWLTVVLVAINALVVCSNITFLTAATRDLFAFSRDNGMPFSSWISRVDPQRPVPQNAAIVTSVITMGMALIYLGSSVAFYAITSLFTVALLQCYCLSIGCILWRRIYHPETLPHAQFSLGNYGITVNSIAVIFGIWSFFWSFWPQSYPVTATTFNWASALFISALLGALIHYVLVGRKRYQGPVALIESRRL